MVEQFTFYFTNIEWLLFFDCGSTRIRFSYAIACCFVLNEVLAGAAIA